MENSELGPMENSELAHVRKSFLNFYVMGSNHFSITKTNQKILKSLFDVDLYYLQLITIDSPQEHTLPMCTGHG